jgi:outer membrane protein assembly factor BamB
VPYRVSQLRAPVDLRPEALYTMPGGILALSAASDQPDSGLLWVTLPIALNANHQVVPGVLRVFDASDVTGELWNSEQTPSRDSFGNLAKFNPPTVVNGKVYVPTFSNQVCVYGKLN